MHEDNLACEVIHRASRAGTETRLDKAKYASAHAICTDVPICLSNECRTLMPLKRSMMQPGCLRYLGWAWQLEARTSTEP